MSKKIRLIVNETVINMKTSNDDPKEKVRTSAELTCKNKDISNAGYNQFLSWCRV